MNRLQISDYLGYQAVEQQDFINNILTKPRSTNQNLLEVWLDWKKEQDEQLQVHSD